MGQLLTLVSGTGDVGEDVIVDFENAKPKTEEEQQVYSVVAAVLDRTVGVLQQLENYTGCDEFIRKAISSPGKENEEAAWNVVVPAVEQLKEFYDYSLELESCFPKILTALCRTDPKTNLINQQALAKQLADCFDFVLRFDALKMVNPAIQNDFSYYRRTLNRMKLSKRDMPLTIRDELANRMSLFFAYPTPMMNVINETTSKFLTQDTTVPRDNVTTALATMAIVCQAMVDKRKFENNNTNLFCLRSMTGSIILFDHLHLQGAFHKKSPIPIKGCISVIKNFAGSEVDGLLNALKFTTIHLNDAETPANIKQLLA